MKTRLSLAARRAGTAALFATAARWPAGSAQSRRTTLHLVGTAEERRLRPRGTAPGDRLGFGDADQRRRHRLRPRVCTIVGKPQIPARSRSSSKGTLTVQGMPPERADKTPVASPAGPAPTTARAAPRS
jgi:hypothetical protein